MKKRDCKEEHLEWVKLTASFLLLLVAGTLLYHTIQKDSGLWGRQETSGVEEESGDGTEAEEAEENREIKEGEGNNRIPEDPTGKGAPGREEIFQEWNWYVQHLMEIWSIGRGVGHHPLFCLLFMFQGSLWKLWKTSRGVLFWLFVFCGFFQKRL